MPLFVKDYILVVEDNPDDEALTLRAFQKNNIRHHIHVVRDGQEAVDFLFSGGPGSMATMGYPAFILLDLQLPKIDGLEILRRMYGDAKISRVPVIVLTTSDEANDVKQAYALHANSYVRKPVDFKDFVEVIGRIGLYWLRSNVACPTDV